MRAFAFLTAALAVATTGLASTVTSSATQCVATQPSGGYSYGSSNPWPYSVGSVSGSSKSAIVSSSTVIGNLSRSYTTSPSASKTATLPGSNSTITGSRSSGPVTASISASATSTSAKPSAFTGAANSLDYTSHGFLGFGVAALLFAAAV